MEPIYLRVLKSLFRRNGTPWLLTSLFRRNGTLVTYIFVPWTRIPASCRALSRNLSDRSADPHAARTDHHAEITNVSTYKQLIKVKFY